MEQKKTETEQLKDFQNRVEINGTLVSIEVYEGESQNTGIPYISVKGEIQFGETGVEVEKFRSFALAQKKDGGENKKYIALKNFVETAIPMTKNKEEATKVMLSGNFAANDYYSDRDGGKVVEGVQNTINFISDFNPNYMDTQGCDSNATAIIDAYVVGITDEVKDNEPTGRKKITLLTIDAFKNPVILKNVVIEAAIANDFDTAYEKGDTAKFFLSRCVHKGVSHAPSSGGFGKKRVTEGRDYIEWRCTGGDEPYEEETKKVITPKIYKELMTVRENILAEVKARGESNTNNTQKSGFSSKSKKIDSPITDDDIPF